MNRVLAVRSSFMLAAGALTALGLACNSGPALTAGQQRGKRIYESLCDKCHKLIAPARHSDNEWSEAAERYGVKLKLQQSEVALLKAYLTRANDPDFK